MRPDLSRYGGREQAYVKHYLLDDYLDALIHKIAHGYNHVVYIDGFSGPWMTGAEDFNDTSFGIALQALRSAKAAWKAIDGRDVRMTAHLVEKRQDAFEELQKLPARFPDVEVIPYKGLFVPLAPIIAERIPRDAFAFIFVDPKGWRINMQAIQPLLRLPNCEVMFNFMFEFINRAASIGEPRIIDALNELMPIGSWRERLVSARSPTERRTILISAFADTLSELGGFSYVADTPVLRPIKDRMIYALVYGTRASKGIEVFRRSQFKTLREQAKVRGAAKLAQTSSITGQSEAFAFVEMGPSDAEAPLTAALHAAERALLSLVPEYPRSILYGDVWPKIVGQYLVQKIDVNKMAAAAKRNGKIQFLDWGYRKQVPEDSYRMCRRDAS